MTAALAAEERVGRLTHRTAPGFTYFVTTKTWDNRAIFQVPVNAEILIECMLCYRDQSSFLLHEFVIMPNHLHLMLTPAADTSLEKAMQLIKGRSSHEIHQRRELKLQIWQPGFHEESVRDANDYLRKTEYIRINPVRAHLVERAVDWPYSSATGAFKMDGVPETFRPNASAAKAARGGAVEMSDLKVRPPKNQSSLPSDAKIPCIVAPVARGLKSPPPESVANVTAMSGLKSPAAENQGTLASGAKAPSLPTQTPGLKSRPPESQHLPEQASDLKVRPPKNHPINASALKPLPPEGRNP